MGKATRKMQKRMKAQERGRPRADGLSPVAKSYTRPRGTAGPSSEPLNLSVTPIKLGESSNSRYHSDYKVAQRYYGNGVYDFSKPAFWASYDKQQTNAPPVARSPDPDIDGMELEPEALAVTMEEVNDRAHQESTAGSGYTITSEKETLTPKLLC